MFDRKSKFYLKKKSLEIALRRLIEFQKPTPALQYTGCNTPFDFRLVIQQKFLDGMTFENYKTVWSLDHIVPQTAFDFSNEDEIMLCYNHRNLLPMFVEDNKSKSYCAEVGIRLVSLMRDTDYRSQYLERLDSLPSFQKYESVIQ